MKKLLFSVMLLFAASFVFSQQAQAPAAANEDPAALIQQNEDFFNSFQQRFQNLKAYDSSRASRETLKQMQDMLDRQKKLIEFKMDEISVLERGGKPIPVKDLSQLKELMDRYQQMTVEMANWTNGRK